MSKKKNHKWLDPKAQSAVADFGFRKERKDKIENSRKRTKMICTVCIDSKPYARIHNHLREHHELTGKKFKKALEKCLPVIESNFDNAASESSGSDARDGEEEIQLK